MSTTEGIYGTNEDNKILFINDAACDLLGYRKADLLSMDEQTFLDNISNQKGKNFQPGKFYSGITLKKQNGQEFIANFKRNRIRGREQEYLGRVGFIQDITESKKVELNERERQKLEALGRLAGGVAHEINNILQTIILTAELAIDNDPKPHKDTVTDLNYIIENTGHAANIARDILSFARYRENEKAGVQNIIPLIDGSLAFLRKLLPIEVEVNFLKTDEILNVKIDPVEIKQVLVNLAVNASDAMNGRGTITFEAFKQNDRAYLYVRDTGPGIPKKILGRIFEPFYTTKKMGEGTGLGLSIVNNILMTWKGTIKIDKTDSQGTSFLITLPLSDSPPP